MQSTLFLLADSLMGCKHILVFPFLFFENITFHVLHFVTGFLWIGIYICAKE